jgi:predicted MFS family arabinose efflux permease
LLAVLTLFFYALTALATILIPIYAYIHGANLQEVIILGVIAVLPQLLSSPLGNIADAWRDRLLPLGLFIIALLIGSLAFITSYALLLPIILFIEVVLVLLGLVVENLVTAASDPAQYGRVSAVFEGLKDVGKFIGAVGFGFALDFIGSQETFLLIACIAILFIVLKPKKAQ